VYGLDHSTRWCRRQGKFLFGSKAVFSVRLLNVCFHQQRTLADAQLIPVEVRPHVGAAVPGLVILLIPRKRLGPLKGCLAVNRIRI